ncbi:GDSL-type esterase/lipase family protein [Amycolatopsis sp. NPDC051903]|uniref:GDSL-type esterase/lipase family protein n=1 Tax=Amycolatopsis sp. NPDC051903 TaxID=3363936 RepID=UPI0037AD48D0
MGLTYTGAALAIAAVSIGVSLTVTPMQTVSVAGQTVQVGAADPKLNASGPGELDMFGQRLPTVVQFAGPVRPRIELSHITVNSELHDFLTPENRKDPGDALGAALVGGWQRYFLLESAIAGGCALLLVGCLAGWSRVPWRRTVALLGAGLLAVEAINVGAVMVTAYSAPARLRNVSSLEALVGRAELPAVPSSSEPAKPHVHAVVLGDSTAAGLGNPVPTEAGPQAVACGRSSDTFAAFLAAVNHWQVLNLACSGATIPAGVLGPQQRANLTAPAQLAVARTATRASVVIVSIGANDVGWSGFLRLCAVTATCDNNASVAYFQQQLARFSLSYYQLLKQLASLPTQPRVLVNLYYNPFGTTQHCLDELGLTAAKQKSLEAQLGSLNDVLSQGAKAFSATPVRPDFTGHSLCDATPYVQGVHDAAPFHPTPAGQLAIALADEHALRSGLR